MKWARTIGFVATQLSAGVLIQLWCSAVHDRFKHFHPEGHGRALPNFYWDYSWTYPVLAVVLSGLLMGCHSSRRERAYDLLIPFGYWLLVVWVGFALIAMEISFVPFLNLRGENW